MTCLGGYLSAGGAGAINHYWDRDIDGRMARTANRPIPAGRISPRAALIFGFTLAALSFALMSLTINVLAASLALTGSSATSGVYTIWLKRRTPHNIVIGGAAGRDAAARRLGGHPRHRCRGRRSTCSRSSSTGRRPISGRSAC